MNVEIDLPGRFLRTHRAAIDAFLEGAIPGTTLVIPLVPECLMHPAVTTSALTNVVEIRARQLDSRSLVLEPADRASARLVDLEEDRLRDKEQTERAGAGDQTPLNAGSPQPVRAGDTIPPTWASLLPCKAA